MPALLEPPAPAKAPPAAPEAPIAIKIPQIGGKAPKEAPKPPVEPPVAPVTPPKPADGAHPGPVLDDDGEEIDTQIMPGGKKSASQFKEERQQSKKDRIAAELGLPEITKERDEFKTKTLTYEAELTRERAERATEKARLAEVEARQKELDQEVEQARSRYFDDYKADFDPREDQELQAAHQTMRGTLLAKMPNRITTDDGEKRVFVDRVLDNPQSAAVMDKAFELYHKAEQAHDPVGMDRAVNLAAQVLGAPVKFSQRPDEEVLLESTHPEFKQIEEAMRAALPAFASRQQRNQFVREQAPMLIQQQITGRETAIKTSLRSAIFLDADTRASLAAVNPMDSGVIIGQILEENPQLSEMINGHIAVSAPAYARMGKIQMPTLASSDPAAIAQHKAEAQRYQAKLGEDMRLAVIGKAAGPIIIAMMGEIKALRERAGANASAENPGGTRSGENGAPPAEDDVIDTQIMPKR